MSKVCQIRGTKHNVANKVSHSNRKNKKVQHVNLQSRRIWVESEARYIKVRLSTSALRDIDKRGIDTVLAELRAKGQSF